MRILVVNAGSSSIKVSVIGPDEVGPTTLASADHLTAYIASHLPLDASGHRIVHGGDRFVDPVVVDDDVLGQLDDLTSLAPLHQPSGLAGMRTTLRALPGAPAVACFDTAFHATIPAAAATYAIPAEWRHRWGLHRFGFHGLSHAWASRRALAVAGVSASRVVTCHLGAGSSLCAVSDGRSVDTTMGFTPLDGLVMATRPGSVDPGLILWLALEGGLDPLEINDALEHRAGLLALGGDADMRVLLGAGDPDSELAIDVWVHRLQQGIAAMTASLQGLDVLAFTGGIGEHAAPLRARAAAGLGFLGVSVDDARNAAAASDADITAAGASVRTVVVTAREDLEIAGHVERLLGGTFDPGGKGL